MNLLKFNKLMKLHGSKLGQSAPEWRSFLEFVSTYFEARNILKPLIVEIGVMNNVQKFFYTGLLNAEHIGIDWSIQSVPDILGPSHYPYTLEMLQTRLKGRLIDLLFIDGDHTYAGIKADYDTYGPLTKYIIAIHDINHPFSLKLPEETMRFWNEIVSTDMHNIHLTIQKYNMVAKGITAGRQMGIGIVLKEA